MLEHIASATPTAENLERLLAECAHLAPRAEIDTQRTGDAFDIALALLEKADDGGLGDAADDILVRFMRSPDVDRKWLAMRFLSLELQALNGLAEVNPYDLHELAFETWKTNLGLAVARGLTPWVAPYRWLVDGRNDNAWVAAALGWDPAWALAHPTAVFGTDQTRAVIRLLFALGELHRDEIVALGRWFSAPHAPFDDELRERLGGTVAEYLARNQRVSAYINEPRWTDVPEIE